MKNSLIHRRRRVDANHRQIKQAFEQMGCSVLDLSGVGIGCPDLLIARCGWMTLVEVKDGSKPKNQQALTDAESLFISKWKSQVHVINSTEQAIALVYEMK